MKWERARMFLAWPLLVIGSPFVLLAAKLGGSGIRYALADTFEQIMEEGNEKRARPYRAISEAPRNSWTNRKPEAGLLAARSPESAFEIVYAERAEAGYPEIQTF